MLLSACSSSKPKPPIPDDLYSAIYNRETNEDYLERAYLDMEPEAMYILGASACLKALGDTSFNRIYTVPLDQAETMLWIAADELQFQPARDLILYLDDLGSWPLSIPNEK